MLRFRPILMTTMAALLGGVPMMIGVAPAPSFASRSAIDRRRLVVSQLLTLYTTPVVYIYLDRLAHVLAGFAMAARAIIKIAPAHPVE